MDGNILSDGHGIQVGFGVLAYGHGVIHMGAVVIIVITRGTVVVDREVVGSYSFQLGYVDGIGVFGTGCQACDLAGEFIAWNIYSIRVTNGYGTQCRFPYRVCICRFSQVSLYTSCCIGIRIVTKGYRTIFFGYSGISYSNRCSSKCTRLSS